MDRDLADARAEGLICPHPVEHHHGVPPAQHLRVLQVDLDGDIRGGVLAGPVEIQQGLGGRLQTVGWRSGFV